MISNLSREIANAVYLVPFQVHKFKEKEPQAIVLAAGATKAQKLNRDEDVRSSVGWVTARRAVLILTNEKLVCGLWEIPLSSVAQASLLQIKGLFGKGFVLKISTNDKNHYQFGLQYDQAWKQQSALPLVITEGKVKQSLLSLILRTILLLYLISLCILPIIINLLSNP